MFKWHFFIIMENLINIQNFCFFFFKKRVLWFFYFKKFKKFSLIVFSSYFGDILNYLFKQKRKVLHTFFLLFFSSWEQSINWTVILSIICSISFIYLLLLTLIFHTRLFRTSKAVKRECFSCHRQFYYHTAFSLCTQLIYWTISFFMEGKLIHWTCKRWAKFVGKLCCSTAMGPTPDILSPAVCCGWTCNKSWTCLSQIRIKLLHSHLYPILDMGPKSFVFSYLFRNMHV